MKLKDEKHSFALDDPMEACDIPKSVAEEGKFLQPYSNLFNCKLFQIAPIDRSTFFSTGHSNQSLAKEAASIISLPRPFFSIQYFPNLCPKVI